MDSARVLCSRLRLFLLLVRFRNEIPVGREVNVSDEIVCYRLSYESAITNNTQIVAQLRYRTSKCNASEGHLHVESNFGSLLFHQLHVPRAT